ncbi:MAG: GNAT family N-acetyltransferase [Anaerolineales bacterium]|nr:GNAT family N-acetyltransferase [Anaerolineales bacterium]
MVPKDDLIYRQVFTLKDGARILLRPITRDDRQALIDLFAPVSAEDMRYMRHNVKDEQLVAARVDQLDYAKELPLIAVFGERIVGICSMQMKNGPDRHRAELRIFLARDFRRRGVGSRLLQGIIDLAKRKNLYMLEVQIVSDQHHFIRSFQNAGFETKCIYADYFMLPDGDLRDVAHLILHIRESDDQF